MCASLQEYSGRASGEVKCSEEGDRDPRDREEDALMSTLDGHLGRVHLAFTRCEDAGGKDWGEMWRLR